MAREQHQKQYPWVIERIFSTYRIAGLAVKNMVILILFEGTRHGVRPPAEDKRYRFDHVMKFGRLVVIATSANRAYWRAVGVSLVRADVQSQFSARRPWLARVVLVSSLLVQSQFFLCLRQPCFRCLRRLSSLRHNQTLALTSSIPNKVERFLEFAILCMIGTQKPNHVFGARINTKPSMIPTRHSSFRMVFKSSLPQKS